MSVSLDHVSQMVDGVAAPLPRRIADTGTRQVQRAAGPTFAGKTSIMRLLAGLDKPAVGRVLVECCDVTHIDIRKRSVAMVYQQFINYPSFTVYENIASPLRVQGKPKAEIDRRVQEAAALLKLEPYLSRTPLQLSGGQQQRTAIARALVKGADLVLLMSRSPISITSCARNCAPNCRRSSRPPARSSSMRPPNRPRRCCWVAARCACGRGRCCSMASPRKCIASRRR